MFFGRVIQVRTSDVEEAVKILRDEIFTRQIFEEYEEISCLQRIVEALTQYDTLELI